MATVHLALLWHQHQPCYVDMAEGVSVLPWVRLHAIKDYYGMAAVLEEFGDIRLTVNLVPAMLDQLESFANGELVDPWMTHRDTPAADLDEAGRSFVAEKFFMASWDRMIRPVERYGELLEMRAFGHSSAAEAAKRFSEADIRDLQVLFNLAWFHPLAVERDERLKGLRQKGRDYSEEDKALLAQCERDILGRVVPLHRELLEQGRIELSTTPHYHPILPLLCDMERAREAMPEVGLPGRRRDLSGDAREQIRRAVESHERRFGARPRGMWPSEGSVSPETVELAAEAGIEWLATDEEILAESLGRPVRDPAGRATEILLRPYAASSQAGTVGMVFRDHELSDHIGFKYQHWDSYKAARDFVARVRDAGRSAGGGHVFLPVILDGENCWEHYPNQGLDFLRGVYRGLSGARDVTTTTIAGYLDAHPPGETLPRVYSGSWINHDFYIWIGTSEDVRAWEMLLRVREALESMTAEMPPEALERAWESMLAAEGSDWFWWFGDDHSSGMDEEFDRLFRTHLANVYRLAGRQVPGFLSEPVLRVQSTPAGAEPTAFLSIQLDGRPTHYFEWMAAGRVSAGVSGSMTRSGASEIEEVYFGFDIDRLFLRIDLVGHRMLSEAEGLEVLFTEPRTVRIVVPRAPRGEKAPVSLRFEDGSERSGVGAAAADACVEICVPFADLGASAGETMRFRVERTDGGDVVESLPESSTIPVTVPTDDFEKGLWQV